MTNLSNQIYHNEDAAREYIEKSRWPEGCHCPLCGGTENIAPVKMMNKAIPAKPATVKRSAIEAKPATEAKGWYHCGDCRRKFTVRTGTIYERSHIPLHKWVLATHLLCSSKKGISAHQLHRMLGVQYRSAWFMAHRIRESMLEVNPPPIGGKGESVQADETYFGTKDALRGKTWAEKKGHSKKMSVVALVSTGKSRTFHVDTANSATVREILIRNVDKETALHTDESRLYIKPGKEFAAHETVHHAAGEYYRDGVHTNCAENYFSIFKRGMRGVYQHCTEKHLQRYLTEFDFRYNSRDISDFERVDMAIKGADGKRLTYRRINLRQAA